MDIDRFERRFLRSPNHLVRIGGGELGGKAAGLMAVRDALVDRFPDGRFPGITVDIPRSAVLTTDLFDRFMDHNRLWDLALSGAPDDRIAHAFIRASLPARWVGDLRALAEEARVPLAVRSSSLLEDAMFRPFAGVYGTKMLPGSEPDPSQRFERLAEAVKLVMASTFFADARRYQRSVGAEPRDEKMAVLVQEVVGQRRHQRFYPTLSAVGRSWNFYPAGRARPRDGVIDLALGLGHTIVSGDKSWSYCPASPRTPPPFSDVRDLLRSTQTRFWCVHMGDPPPHDPVREAEHLVQADLSAAEYDDTLRHVASTLDARTGRRVPGVGVDGPRLLDFAPILRLGEPPLNDVFRELLTMGEEVRGSAVEIELAAVLDRRSGTPARVGLLQVRPMVVSRDPVDLPDALLDDPRAVVASTDALGNAVREDISDVVYVRPDTFDPSLTPRIAAEVERLDAGLQSAGRPYVLVGFGRWGTSDPWYGIPVTWAQIAGSRVIVEATLPGVDTDLSQGSHFFHNVTSFQVLYLSHRHGSPRPIDWEWLESLPEVAATEHVRHVRCPAPLSVRVDGRSGRGVILRHDP